MLACGHAGRSCSAFAHPASLEAACLPQFLDYNYTELGHGIDALLEHTGIKEWASPLVEADATSARVLQLQLDELDGVDPQSEPDGLDQLAWGAPGSQARATALRSAGAPLCAFARATLPCSTR